jgi:hypothetical protein
VTAPTPTGTDGAQAVDAALELLNAIQSGSWIPSGLSTGNLADLSAMMRPIDAVTEAGLGWLVPYLQPLQDVLDQMAGKAAVVQSYADAWQQASAKVDDVRTRLAALAGGDTTGWGGTAFEEYQKRAQDIQLALEAAAHVCAATSLFTQQAGQVIANARRQVNDLFTALVTRLVSYVRTATAAQGGQVTPEVLYRCTSMINNCWQQIELVRQQLDQALGSLGQGTTQAGDDGFDYPGLVVTILSLLPWVRFGRIASGIWRFIRTIMLVRGKTSPPAPKPTAPTVVPSPDWATKIQQAGTKIPKEWGPGLLNKKGVGTRWQDPNNQGNGVRIDQGSPNSSSPSQQADHVVVNSGGKILGPDGNPIAGSLKQNPQAHIPLSDWQNWQNWNSPK